MSPRRTFVIDGHNVLHSCELYALLSESDIDAARARLVSDVAAYTDDDRQAIVVFDGGANPASDGSPNEIAGVTVIFSSYGVDADTVIERETSMRCQAGEEVVVVTSDAQTQWAVMGMGAVRMSSAGFVAEVAVDLEERAEADPSGSGSTTLADLVDPATRDVLARWARGVK